MSVRLNDKMLNPMCDIDKSGKKGFKGAVYLQGNCFYDSAVRLWEGLGYELVNNIPESDIVCWLGGADINPQLYGEKPNGASGWSDFQDRSDLKALSDAGNRFKVGICRGAQILNVIPNGGTLWQDTDGHGGGSHDVVDVRNARKYVTNTIHHQQLRLGAEGVLLAYSEVSKFKECQEMTWHRGSTYKGEFSKDVEACWYPKTRSLLVQWHPEVGGGDSVTYFESLLKEFYENENV
jgi:gamma-glutamyl-gamma-aminobutyrate hydrolase PuuD